MHIEREKLKNIRAFKSAEKNYLAVGLDSNQQLLCLHEFK